MTGIEKAVAEAGGQGELAKLVGVTRQAIQQWVARGRVPFGRHVEIEALTGVPQGELLGAQQPFGD